MDNNGLKLNNQITNHTDSYRIEICRCYNDAIIIANTSAGE